tara:strand:- start:876 stop:1319 length:444 start_codon:yes stop_codon:yes gene_type:complete
MAKVARAARVASRQRPESISGSKTIESAETGELYLVSAAASVTLPAVQDGAYFKFILTADITSGTALVITAAGSAKIAGLVIATHTTNLRESVQADPGGNKTTLTIGSASNKVLAGSSVECFCDGTNWYVTGTVSGNASDITTCAFS